MPPTKPAANANANAEQQVKETCRETFQIFVDCNEGVDLKK